MNEMNPSPSHPPLHIFAAMSGGVDSTVMAALLIEQGFRVTGATMKLYRPGMSVDADGVFHAPDTDGSPTSCGSDADIADARAVCNRLGIAHLVFNYGETFCRTVIADFVREYEAGGTPNPCIVCNRQLKFGALLQAALDAGADGIATGHYARVEKDPAGRYLLRKAADERKDQTYVLWRLSQHQLAHTLFPLGGLRKTEIRQLAEELDLVTAHKSESQDICFVPDGDYASFLARYTGRVPMPGEYVSEDGQVLGQHQGITHYTVGQRKGLGIALGQPMFVLAKDAATRRVVLTTDDRLFTRVVPLQELNLIATDRIDAPLRVEAKIRYQHKAAPATLTPTSESTATLVFDEPQRAPADGQSAVFYDGDTVIGGGIIRMTGN